MIPHPPGTRAPPLRRKLTLGAARPLVADGADAVAVGAGAVAAAQRVDALRDGDVALGPLPAAVAHAGALVVLAVAAAQHRAGGWSGVEEKERPEGGGEGRRRLKTERKTISSLLRDPQSGDKQ